jgi:predicted DNA-binding transcriptional regulator AlpA
MPNTSPNDQPLALPAKGQTATSRPAKAPATDALSIEQAAERYAISQSTIYRRLHRDEVPAAYKVLGPQGESWRIPLGSLDALGYQPVDTDAIAVATQPTEALEGVLSQLTALLDSQQRQLQAAEGDRDLAARAAQDQAIANARLEAQLEATAANLADAKAKLEQTEQQLEAARSRRRWFSRKSD